MNGSTAIIAVALWFMKLRPTWPELLAIPDASSSAADCTAPAARITSFGRSSRAPPPDS